MVPLEREILSSPVQMKKLYSELYEAALIRIFCEVRILFSPFLLFRND